MSAVFGVPPKTTSYGGGTSFDSTVPRREPVGETPAGATGTFALPFSTEPSRLGSWSCHEVVLAMVSLLRKDTEDTEIWQDVRARPFFRKKSSAFKVWPYWSGLRWFQCNSSARSCASGTARSLSSKWLHLKTSFRPAKSRDNRRGKTPAIGFRLKQSEVSSLGGQGDGLRQIENAQDVQQFRPFCV